MAAWAAAPVSGLGRSRRARGGVGLALLLGVAGCGPLLSASTADVAGIASAGVAGAVTRNAVVAGGIGLGVAAGANAGLQLAERDTHRIEQDRIAAAAGDLEPGAVGRWSVGNRIPIETAEHGELVVTRVIGAPDLACKEIVFSVDRGEGQALQRAFYTATVCRDGATWRWATAEPATERWGPLQ